METKSELKTVGKSATKPIKDQALNDVYTMSSTSAFPIPDCVPYRRSCGYAMIWSILYVNRKDGITKVELIEKYQAWSGKPQKNCGYDVQVVCSVQENGNCNRSAAKASTHYWVENKDGLLKLHLRD